MGLIVRSRIKEIAGEINVAGDLGDALDKKAEEMLRNAIERAKANGRRTVMAKDL
jgi:histone H3/H4